MRQNRLLILSSLVLALTVLGPATAHGAAGGTDRPLKGTETATAVINVVMHTCSVSGPFRYAHLGNGTFHADTTLTALTPTTNHIAGTRALHMSAAADFDGDSILDLALPSLDRSRLRLIAFAPKDPTPREIASVALPAKAVTNIGLVAIKGSPPALAVGLADGSLVLIRRAQ